MHPLKTLIVAAVLLATAAPLCHAQAFGQWWWGGDLGAEEHSFENRVNTGATTTYGERRLRLGLGIGGYLGHPLIGNFELGVTAMLSRFENTSQPESDHYGIRGRVELFPRGSISLRLRLAHEDFGYIESSGDPSEPLPYGRLPATSQSWGVETFFRNGILDTMRIGASGATTDFIDPDYGTNDDAVQYLEWNPSTNSIHHHLYLEHRARSYSGQSYDLEDIIFNLSENGRFGNRWNWTLQGNGTLRQSTYRNREDDYQIFYLRNNLTRSLSQRGELRLSQSSSYQGKDSDGVFNHTLEGTYRWLLSDAWQLVPRLSINLQHGANRSLSTPQIGVDAIWTRGVGGADLTAFAGTRWGRSSGHENDEEIDQDTLSLNCGGGIGIGNESSLRAELDILAIRDQLDAGELPVDLPDLGTGYLLAGTEDVLQALLTLRRRFRMVSTRLELQWQDRRRRPDFDDQDQHLQRSLLRLSMEGSRFNVYAATTDTALEDERGPQNDRTSTARVMARPWNLLTMGATYRLAERDFEAAPEVDSTFYSVDLGFEIAGFVLSGEIFESVESRPDGFERSNRGISWSISRGFGGWLPIVTATQRRGVIK